MSLLMILGLVVIGLLLIAGLLALRFQFTLAAVGQQVLAATANRPVAVGDLPDAVRRVADHAGARIGEGRAVRLTQSAQMQWTPGGNWTPMDARQDIGLNAPGFAWVATRRFGPLPVMTILDAFAQGRGLLKVRLLGAVPVANAEGADLDLGEAMRYLAELPWAPDAILNNPLIGWRVAPDGWLEARLPVADRQALVRLRLNPAGDIVEITAKDRPARMPDGSIILRDWRGVFADHAQMGGRRIPLTGEVGYGLGETYQPYWRGRILSYDLV